MKEYSYFSDCVSWPLHVDLLHEVIDNSIEVTRKTFLKNCLGVKQWADEHGYTHWKQGLTMASDWAISYHRSKLKGKRVYYFKWSAIEHVFTKDRND